MVRNVQATLGTMGPQCKGSQTSARAANAPQFMPRGRLRNQHPTSLFSSRSVSLSLSLSCPQSLCLSTFHFSKCVEARKCFLYSKICVRLLGYVVLQCDVEGNKARAHRKGRKKQLHVFSLIQRAMELG